MLEQKQVQGFITTPPIWINEQFGITQFEFPDISGPFTKPVTIPQNRRLGHQMEFVCKQLLKYSTAYEVLVHNLPIKKGKQTTGEIDFILKEIATNQLIHLELTYKFYLINPEVSEPIHQLVGPNRRDMFFTKMEKIKNKQFALLHTSEAELALGQFGIQPNELKHQACFKAQLFEPYKSTPLPLRPLNPKCIVGYWLRLNDFNTADFSSYTFYIPTKSEWVIPPNNEALWENHYHTLLAINLRLLKQNAPLVWMKKSDTTFEKFFIVWW